MGLRAVFIAAFTTTALVLAASSFAANTATIAISTAGTVTTFHITVPQTTDPMARIAIYVPAGYTANLTAAANTNLGSVDAAALGHDVGLTLPLTGPLTATSPTSLPGDQCSPGTHAAIWNLNLSVAGSSIVLPLYVDPTSGASAALGAYQMIICLPPWDVPVGTPGRSFQGAQLLDAQFSVTDIFTAPASGLNVWHTLFTPYNPGKGTPNLVGTFEARALAGTPSLSLKATKAKGRYTVSGKLSEGGVPVAGTSIVLLRGTTPATLPQGGKATTGAAGTWSTSGKLTGKKTVYFKATATSTERDATATGCATPLPATVAPGGCVSATLAKWTVASPVAKLKP
jgi:hypothetical protein